MFGGECVCGLCKGQRFEGKVFNGTETNKLEIFSQINAEWRAHPDGKLN